MNVEQARQLNAYELAHMAGCQSPDSLESPGAQFLNAVASYVIDEHDTDPSQDTTDVSAYAADSSVPIYTHQFWLTFVDLAAYQEDLENACVSTADLSLEQCAQHALYMIGERLAAQLWEELGEDDETEEAW